MFGFGKTNRRLGVALGLGLAFLLVDGAFLQPGLVYDFKGYFAPTVLVSPLREDIVYSPVGVGRITSGAGFRRHPVTGKHSFHSDGDDADAIYALAREAAEGVIGRRRGRPE